MGDLVELDGYPFQTYKVNGKKKASYRPVKLFLIEKYRVCFHCGKNVHDIIMDGHGLPHNAATIDHLIPRQFRKRHARVQKVLSCHECNKRRNEEVQAVGVSFSGRVRANTKPKRKLARGSNKLGENKP